MVVGALGAHEEPEIVVLEAEETDQSPGSNNSLSLSRELTDFDRNKIFQSGTVYITQQINPINWDTQLFM